MAVDAVLAPYRRMYRYLMKSIGIWVGDFEEIFSIYNMYAYINHSDSGLLARGVGRHSCSTFKFHHSTAISRRNHAPARCARFPSMTQRIGAPRRSDRTLCILCSIHESEEIISTGGRRVFQRRRSVRGFIARRPTHSLGTPLLCRMRALRAWIVQQSLAIRSLGLPTRNVVN